MNATEPTAPVLGYAGDSDVATIPSLSRAVAWLALSYGTLALPKRLLAAQDFAARPVRDLLAYVQYEWSSVDGALTAAFSLALIIGAAMLLLRWRDRGTRMCRGAAWGLIGVAILAALVAAHWFVTTSRPPANTSAVVHHLASSLNAAHRLALRLALPVAVLAAIRRPRPPMNEQRIGRATVQMVCIVAAVVAGLGVAVELTDVEAWQRRARSAAIVRSERAGMPEIWNLLRGPVAAVGYAVVAATASASVVGVGVLRRRLLLAAATALLIIGAVGALLLATYSVASYLQGWGRVRTAAEVAIILAYSADIFVAATLVPALVILTQRARPSSASEIER